MCDQPDPFIFPELPAEAAAALDQLIEDFYDSFQQRYGIQLYRYYRAIEERAVRHRPVPSTPPPLHDPHSENPRMTAAPTPRSRSLMAHQQS